MTGPSTRVTASIPEFLEARQSIRSFLAYPIDETRLDALVAAAATAPAPHHSRPWRFAVITSSNAKGALANGMGARWRRDLEHDGVDVARIDELVERSERTLARTPALIVACLTDHGLDRYPDEPRRRAEWGMGVLSLGAAIENLMLAATDGGLASCWMAAPIFCPDDAREALDLPREWVPQALVLLGEPDPTYEPRTRPPIDVDELRVKR
jgi:coenzyme F420-0:L-glutamate ligase / coenzyme F420-1:gamma-L-glutamate ligase